MKDKRGLFGLIFIAIIVVAIAVGIYIGYVAFSEDGLVDDIKDELGDGPGDDGVVANTLALDDCGSSDVFGCRRITQGESGDEPAPAPIVCGCIPECDVDEYLVASSSGYGEVWEDGSAKGTFECADEMPA